MWHHPLFPCTAYCNVDRKSGKILLLGPVLSYTTAHREHSQFQLGCYELLDQNRRLFQEDKACIGKIALLLLPMGGRVVGARMHACLYSMLWLERPAPLGWTSLLQLVLSPRMRCSSQGACLHETFLLQFYGDSERTWCCFQGSSGSNSRFCRSNYRCTYGSNQSSDKRYPRQAGFQRKFWNSSIAAAPQHTTTKSSHAAYHMAVVASLAENSLRKY
mmetsp:Transcript_138350/g.275803  ORF Transcript_138350/g.275803 Transcript_138350/m.275803 type:complete len:217 (-) Transcript_138350:227-877(-)